MIVFDMEFFARERQQTLLEVAEQHRLLKKVAAQQANQATTTRQLRCWLGIQVVKWGFQLQGYRGPLLPQLPECEPYNN